MDIIIILDYRDEHTNLTLGEEEREREKKKLILTSSVRNRNDATYAFS